MATGINYARLIADAHHAELAEGVNYAALTSAALTSTNELPGQLDLLTGAPIDSAPIDSSEITS